MYSFNRYHFPAIRYEAGWWISTDNLTSTAALKAEPDKHIDIMPTSVTHFFNCAGVKI